MSIDFLASGVSILIGTNSKVKVAGRKFTLVSNLVSRIN